MLKGLRDLAGPLLDQAGQLSDQAGHFLDQSVHLLASAPECSNDVGWFLWAWSACSDSWWPALPPLFCPLDEARLDCDLR